MQSEGFFFRGRGQYTIFLHSRPERANFHLKWHFLAVAQKNNIVSLEIVPNNICQITNTNYIGETRYTNYIHIVCSYNFNLYL